MNSKPRKQPISSSAAVLAGILTAAAATTAGASMIEIAGNFGPGDSFNVVSSFLVLGPNHVSIGNTDQAVWFTTGDQPVYATQVDLALRHNAGLNGVAVSIYSNDGGLPGSALVSTAIGGIPGGVAEVVTASFGAPLLLDANTTYWVVADAGFDTDISWNWNDTGMTGKAGRGGWPVGPWNFNPDVQTPAFRVMGRAVPGPGAFAALAGLGLAATRRRRNA